MPAKQNHHVDSPCVHPRFSNSDKATMHFPIHEFMRSEFNTNMYSYLHHYNVISLASRTSHYACFASVMHRRKLSNNCSVLLDMSDSQLTETPNLCLNVLRPLHLHGVALNRRASKV
jgi:hypothetical protein